ncbi:L-rhamnose/proton symporter RhaT, partial [Klebsiella pneumoniae]
GGLMWYLQFFFYAWGHASQGDETCPD